MKLGMSVDPRPHIAGKFVNWNIVGDILIATGIAGIVASILLAAAAGGRGASTVTPTPDG
jgi:hypothetical protein